MYMGAEASGVARRWDGCIPRYISMGSGASGMATWVADGMQGFAGGMIPRGGV
jgi:hypothetical protein